jgi:hypothetical protein
MPIHMKVVELGTNDFKTPALLLEKYKGLLKGNTESQLSGSLFAVKVKKTAEEFGSVTDMIEEHHVDIIQL